MIIAIIILSAVAILEAAYIFLIRKVLKNTFPNIVVEYLDEKPKMNPEVAYNGKYYPATVLAKTIFNSDYEMVVADFSMYETHNIVGFNLHVPESIEEYYKNYANITLSEEDAEGLKNMNFPAIFPNAQVYEIEEGTWTWK